MRVCASGLLRLGRSEAGQSGWRFLTNSRTITWHDPRLRVLDSNASAAKWVMGGNYFAIYTHGVVLAILPATITRAVVAIAMWAGLAAIVAAGFCFEELASFYARHGF